MRSLPLGILLSLAALPATLFWDRPTIDAVAGLLVERIEADRISSAA